LKDLSKSDTLRKDVIYLPNQLERVHINTQHSTDSISQSIANLNGKAQDVQRYTQNKTDSLQEKIIRSTTNLKNKAESELSGIADKGRDIPSVEKLQLPSGEKQIPSLSSVNSPDLSPNLKTNIPDTKALQIPSTNLNTDLKDVSLPQTTDLDKISNIPGELKDIDGKLGEVENYQADLQNLQENDPENLNKLSEQAEQKLTEVSDVGAVSKEIARETEEQAKYEAMVQRYRDRKLLEEEISRKYKAVANDYVTQQAGKVQEAQKQLELSKYKPTRGKSVKDVFKKQSDELEDKKFYQRLVPGLNWQVYNKGFVSSDISLQVGYRLTPRLTSGIGMVYRVGFDKKFDSFVKGMNTFGGRVYMDMLVIKGMFVHGEFEALKQDASYKLNTNEPISSRVYESNFGLGKRFNITRSIRGNIIAIYRVEYRGELPAANKVNVRMGIDYVFRRPKKKLNGL
jgi:myosin heavy subunit